MRRTPLVGLLVFSMLGFSGCAGVSRQLNWSSPSTAPADAAETPAPNRFSWWRPPQAESTTTNSAGYFAQVNRAEPPADSTKVPGDVWPEPKQDWTVRYFPHLTRLWSGNATRTSPEADPGSDAVRVSSRSRPPAASYGRRADDDVRPVDASADDEIAARDGASVAEKRERFVPPVVPTPLLVRSRPDFVPERTSDVELDISKVDSSRESRGRSDASETPVKDREPASTSPSPVAQTPVLAMAPGDDSRTEPPAENTPAAEPGSASASIASPEQEPAQAPAPPGTQAPAIPPPPPLNRTPPPPPINDGEKAAAKPDQPEAPPAPKVTEEPKPVQPQEPKPQSAPVPPAADAPASSAPPASPAPAAAAVAPISAQKPPLASGQQLVSGSSREIYASPPAAAVAPISAQKPPLASGQRLVSGSSREIYASPPPMAPPRPRRKFLSLFFVEEKTEPLASPQLPVAAFPTTYYPRPYPVLTAPPQANDVKSPGNMFPTTYNGPYPRPYPVLTATPQASDVKSPDATATAKKPCVLTTWFQKITSGRHRFGCCHHACSAPCCSGCTCHTGKEKSVASSPNGSGASPLASPQADSATRRGPLPQAVPTGSTGPKPGDVAEEGKLFERVSFESFDKSPQS